MAVVYASTDREALNDLDAHGVMRRFAPVGSVRLVERKQMLERLVQTEKQTLKSKWKDDLQRVARPNLARNNHVANI